LGGAVLVVLALAVWFFWQWWHASHRVSNASPQARVIPAALAHAVPAATPRPVSQIAAPAPAPKPKPAVAVAPAYAPVVTLAPTKPAPATPGTAGLGVLSAPPVAPPPAAHKAAKIMAPPPRAWPADLKLTAIFYSRANPRVLINGNFYVTGDIIDGIIIKEIEKNKVTVEWAGETKVVTMDTNN
jgi:hypothetical protein